MSQVWAYLSVAALLFTGLLLVFIILLQRGRGGGLAGAFGGAGGQSALGTKAGDVFTKITVGLAVFWVLLACLSIYALRAGSEGRLALGDTTDSVVASDAGTNGIGPDGESLPPTAGAEQDEAGPTSPGVGTEMPADESNGSGPALPTPGAGEPDDASSEGDDAAAPTTP